MSQFLQTYANYSLNNLPKFESKEAWKDAKVNIHGFISPIEDIGSLNVSQKQVELIEWKADPYYILLSLNKDFDEKGTLGVIKNQAKEITEVNGVLLEVNREYWWSQFYYKHIKPYKYNTPQLATQLRKLTDHIKTINKEILAVERAKDTADLYEKFNSVSQGMNKTEIQAMIDELKKKAETTKA